MRNMFLTFAMILMSAVANATPIVLYDNESRLIGTSDNPLPVSISGSAALDSLVVSGNIGAGTTAPAAKLQVDGAIYGGTTAPSHSGVSMSQSGDAMFGGDVEVDGALYVDSGIYATGNGVFTGSLYSGGTGVNQFAANYVAAGSLSGVTYVNGTGDIYAQDAIESDGTIYGNNVLVSGNLGVGTTGSNYKFEVSSGNTFGDLVVDTANKTVYIGRKSPTSGDSTTTIFQNRSATELLKIDGPNTRITTGTSIPIGIGTTTPGAFLDVGGGTVTYLGVGFNDAHIRDGLEVDGAVYVGTGTVNYAINSAGNVYVGGKLEVDGGIYVTTVTPAAYPTITTSSNLTIANLSTADYFPVDTTSGSVTVTLYSNATDNGIPSGHIGRTITFVHVAGTNDMILAVDADLTYVNKEVTSLEDVGDTAYFIPATEDIVVGEGYAQD